jgi:hypothetical protein
MVCNGEGEAGHDPWPFEELGSGRLEGEWCHQEFRLWSDPETLLIWRCNDDGPWRHPLEVDCYEDRAVALAAAQACQGALLAPERSWPWWRSGVRRRPAGWTVVW